MKDTQFEAEQEQLAQNHSQAYLDGVQAIEDRKNRQIQKGYGTMLIAASMAGGADRGGEMPLAARIAQRFCILFAFVAPNVLFMMYGF